MSDRATGTSAAIGIMDALDYPDELDPLYRVYHARRNAWEREREAFEIVAAVLLDVYAEPDHAGR